MKTRPRRQRVPIVTRARLALLVGALAATAHAADQRPDAIFETALATFNLQRYEDACNLFYDFMAAAPNDPRNDQAQYYVGRSNMHRRFFNKAVEEFGYLIEDFPRSEYARLGLSYRAQCRLETRQEAAAAEDYEALIVHDVVPYVGEENAMLRMLYENHRNAVFWLAKYRLGRQEHEKAIAAYRRLPHPIEAFRYVVEVYYGLGQFDRIRELIEHLQQEHRHEGFKLLIEFYARGKAFNQLREIFDMLLRESAPDQKTDDLVWTTADGFRNFGQEHWEWAMRHVSEHYPRLARRADYHLITHHRGNAAFLDTMELFAIKYRDGRDVNAVLRWKGVLLEGQGRAEDARQDYRRMGDAGLGHWFAAESYHGHHARARDVEAAVLEYENLRRAFYSQEWSALAQWRIADLLTEAGDVDKAADAWRQVVARFGSIAIEKLWHGNIDHQLGVYVEKREYGPDAQLRLGDVLRAAGRHEDAVLEYRAAVTRWPKSDQAAWAAFRTALCYEGLNDPDTVIRVIQSVLRRYPQTRAAGDAHTLLESKYKIADVQIADTVDFFEVDGGVGKDYLEDPAKMRRNP